MHTKPSSTQVGVVSPRGDGLFTRVCPSLEHERFENKVIEYGSAGHGHKAGDVRRRDHGMIRRQKAETNKIIQNVRAKKHDFLWFGSNKYMTRKREIIKNYAEYMRYYLRNK
jgi:hypothetical protein